MFARNRTEVTAVEEIVDMMEARYGQENRVSVMDRGMTSDETVAWSQVTGPRHLIGANETELKKLAPQLADARDWYKVRAELEAKLCTGPGGGGTFMLVRAAELRARERAMHACFCERIETAVPRLAWRLEQARRAVDRSAAQRQIDRLLGRNTRAGGRCAIRLIKDATVVAGLRLEWSARDESHE